MSRLPRSYDLAIIAALVLGGCTGTDDGGTATSVRSDQQGGLVAGADYVFTDGRVYTLDPEQPWAEAVAVTGNEIVYVGDNAGAEVHKGTTSVVVNLGGRLMLPGFIESHIHAAMGGATTSGIILTMADTAEEVLEKVKAYAEGNPDKPTLFGASYNGLLFDERGPNKSALDAIVPDRPVYLMDHTLHSVWVNSKALEIAGIDADTPDPVGGEYVRDDHGEATGAVKGGPAHMPILLATDAINADSMRASIPNVLEGLSEFGFTAAIDMGAPIATEAGFQALVDLDNAGELSVRMSLTHYINHESMAGDAVETMLRFRDTYRSDHVWVDTLKITIDSVIENQKAAMLEPYLSTGDRGSLMIDHETMKMMVLGAAEEGFNITVHAIGDRGVRAALDAAAELRAAGYDDILFSTTHSQMVDPDDRRRYVELDVTAQTTGNWAMPQPSYAEHLGQDRNDTLQFPFRYWADNGVNIAFGADWPATPGGFEHGVNPFNNIYTSMHRRVPERIIADMGSTDQPLPPLDQTLTLEEAVEAYTMGSARMLGIEDKVGSIEVGKLADLILLDRNLFEIDPEDIYRTRVLATMMDGVIRHDITFGLGDNELADVDRYDEHRPEAAYPR